jgi:hypothetical protein
MERVPSVSESIELVRKAFFEKHDITSFVDVMWENLQDARYGAAWAKLLLLYVGMPAERKALDITMPTIFTQAELAGARHARLEAGKEALVNAIEGEYKDEDATVLPGSRELAD